MLSLPLLTQYLALAHCVVAIGVGSWYFGVIPRPHPERRYLPLGFYFCLTLLVEAFRCSGYFYPPVVDVIPWVQALAILPAAALLFWAHRAARAPGENTKNWPISLRLCFVLHAAFTFLLPVASISQPSDLSAALLGTGGIATLVLLVISHAPLMRDRGHYMHWSIVFSVLACLIFGWFAVIHIFDQGLRAREHDLTNQALTFAELIQPDLLTLNERDSTARQRVGRSLAAVCNSSPWITQAFVLNAVSPDHSALATATKDADHLIFPLTAAADRLAINRVTAPTILMVDSPGSGATWTTALAPILRDGIRRPIGLVGFAAPTAQLHTAQRESVFITELIVLFVALVVYASIAGYLHGLVRVWQRDALLSVIADASQRLLKADSPADVAPWLTENLQRRLNLMHACFGLSSQRQGVSGLSILAAYPPENEPAPWRALGDLDPVWLNAIQNRQSIEGPLAHFAKAVPHLPLTRFRKPWLILEIIEHAEQPWGALALVFPGPIGAAHTEIRAALRSLTNAFSSCLAREKRSVHLAATEDRLRTIIETSPDGFWDIDYAAKTQFRSNRWWRMLGYEPPSSPDDLEQFEYLIDPDDLVHLKADAVESLPPGRNFRRREFRARHRSGSWHWIESRSVELRLTQGPAQRALGFDRDITDRQDYEQRLRTTAESAARANRAKSEFFASLSHDLRTPLNRVIGFASHLERSPLKTAQHEWVSTIRDEATQLLGLIGNVLDFSQIEAGKLELERSTFELRRAAEHALEPFARLATDKSIALHLQFEADPSPVWVVGDALRLLQILTNLVSNALKFTTEGHVTLLVRPLAHDEWEFVVEDTGSGIPAGQISSLFERFSPPNTSTNRHPSSPGLGLAISRELARAMQGDITVSSIPKQGSRFTAVVTLTASEGHIRRRTDQPAQVTQSLPILLANAADLAAVRSALADSAFDLLPFTEIAALVAHVKSAPKPVTILIPRAFRPVAITTARQLRAHLGLDDGSSRIVGIQPASPGSTDNAGFDVELPAPLRRRELIELITQTKPVVPPLPDLSPKSNLPPANARTALQVLVAEDHPVNREVIGTMLDHLGVTTDFAENGQVAIERLKTKRYDVALIDIQMPVIDGYGVATWLRTEWHDQWPKPKIAAVTANAANSDRERCLSAGMDDYVAKPITFPQLSALLKRLGPSSSITVPRPSSDQPTLNRPTTPEANSASPGDDLVDWAGFESILMFTNAVEEPEALRRILETYLEDCLKVLDQVEALDPSDHAHTRELLHKLKGSTGSLALNGVVPAIRRLHDPEVGPPAAERASLLRLIRKQAIDAVAALRRRYVWLNADQA